MDLKEAILSRRSVRVYQDRLIEDDVLQEVIEAGLWGPSAVDLQPWYFVVLRSKERIAQLAAIMEQVSAVEAEKLRVRFARHPEVAAEALSFIRRLGGAPVCILVFQLKPEYPSNKQSTIIQSVAAAIENMLLMATAHGLGSCWLTAPLETEMENLVRDAFAPDKGQLIALISLGYPEKVPKAPLRKDGRYVIC